MKILIVHNRYKQYGGEDTVVFQELEAYKELGHQVELFEEKNSEMKKVDLLMSFFNISSAITFKKKIKEFNPEVIHFHNILFKISPSVLWVIPKDIKVFMTIHNYRFLCPSGTLFHKGKINLLSKFFPGLIRNIYKGVYQESIFKTAFLALIYFFHKTINTFDRVDKFIFLTCFAKDIHIDWKRYLFKKHVIKPNFLSEEVINKKSEKIIDLIYVGRFTEEKGISDIINVLIESKHLNIHLIGNGPESDTVINKCSSHSHITLHGKLNRDQVLKIMKTSKYLIFPSLWYEGMPMTIIEAYALGVPVISRNIGAMSDMILNSKTGFHYNNHKQLLVLLKGLGTYDYSKLSFFAYEEYINKYSKKIGLNGLNKLLFENIS